MPSWSADASDPIASGPIASGPIATGPVVSDAIASWDRAAQHYDRASAWLEGRFLREGRRWVCERAQGRVLDVGIGTGANLAFLGHATTFVGVDPSSAMLDVARTKASALGREVDLHQASAEALPFDDATFDTVLVTYVLCNVRDVATALREAGRVVRPGGSLLLADHVVSTQPFLRWGQRRLESVTGPRRGEWFTRRPRALVEDEPGWRVMDGTRAHHGIIETLSAERTNQRAAGPAAEAPAE